MKKLAFTVIAILLFAAAAAAEDDSMANFKSLVENFKPSAADMGGMSAPEIYSVQHYPYHPQAGRKVTVRAMVGSYNSMVPYKVTRVSLDFWKIGEKIKTLEMKPEDQAHGIFAAELPAFSDGDEVLYTVTATDDWGNVSVEIPPDANLRQVMADTEDGGIDPAMDIKTLFAGLGETNKLTLCMDLREKAKRMIKTDLAAYAFVIFGDDVRYKPEQTESEFTSGWFAGYLPNFMIKDLIPSGDLMSALAPGGKKTKRADFSEKGNRLCFTFPPETIRSDYANGIKVIGATIAINTSPMTIKPTDTTHAVMLYPTVHSFKVYKLK